MSHNTNKGRKLGPSNRAVWPSGWKKGGPTKERLHAAAPDMLEALKDIIGMAEAHADRVRRQRGNEIVTANIDASIAVARAAIAKAEGTS